MNRKILSILFLVALVIFGLFLLRSIYWKRPVIKNTASSTGIAEGEMAQLFISSTQVLNVTRACVRTDVKSQGYKELSFNCSDADLDALLLKYPDCVECYLAKADHYSGYNKIAVLNAAIKGLPNSAKLYSQRADLLVREFTEKYPRDLHVASEDYSRLISMAPEDVANYLGRCQALALSQDSGKKVLQGAWGDCDSVLRKSSGTAAAYFFRGVVEMRLGRLKEALESVSQAIALAPSAEYQNLSGIYFPVHYFRAKIYFALKYFPESEKDYRIAAERKPKAEMFDELVYFYLKTGNKDGALEALRKSESLGEDNSARSQGLWASYYWVYEKNIQLALDRIEGILMQEGMSFPKAEFGEFLSGLFDTKEYQALVERMPKKSDETDVVSKPGKIDFGAYIVEGACKKNDISDQSEPGQERHYSFDIFSSTVAIKSTAAKCSKDDVSVLTEFAERDRYGEEVSRKVNVGSYSHAANGLIPKNCVILRNPGVNGGIAVIKFLESSLCLIAIDSWRMPQKTLACYTSRKSIYDNFRAVDVERICDTDGDGLVEVVLRDSRYAGYGFWLNKFNEGLSSLSAESVEGFRGD